MYLETAKLSLSVNSSFCTEFDTPLGKKDENQIYPEGPFWTGTVPGDASYIN
jgi:hypothetical protein